MNLSQKCLYALRATFELARRGRARPVRASEIAEAQAIPQRFLELILSELRGAGYVESRRGVQGGYLLAVEPGEISVGEIVRLMDGPVSPVRCLGTSEEPDCPLHGRCAFLGLWSRAAEALSGVFDETSLQDLLDESTADEAVLDYCI